LGLSRARTSLLTKSDHVTIPGNVLSEGEKDKIIQHPENNINPDEVEQQSAPNEVNPPVNSIPFPPSNTTQSDSSSDADPEPEVEPLNVSRNTQARHATGHYKRLHEGKDASVAAVMETVDEDDDVPGLIDEDDDDDLFAPLPADLP
jgi:hypothetical protein